MGLAGRAPLAAGADPERGRLGRWRVTGDKPGDAPQAEHGSSLAATSTLEPSSAQSRPVGDSRSLTGLWTSRYRYSSTSRAAEFDGTHDVELIVEDGRLVGRSLPHPTGGSLRLELAVDGILATGSWTERTSPTGHHRAATFHGVLQFVIDPTRQAMAGRWLGISPRYAIKSGEWTLERAAPAPAP